MFWLKAVAILAAYNLGAVLVMWDIARTCGGDEERDNAEAMAVVILFWPLLVAVKIAMGVVGWIESKERKR